MSPTIQNHDPKVSIIIPAYNTAGLIPACLDSVFAQTYKDFEAVVVNDGSPDTPELEKSLAPYADRIVYIKQPNKRAAGARNTGIARAGGEFLAFLDSDDVWLPDHLASQMKLFEDDPSLGLVYSDALIVGDPSNEWRFTERCPSHGEATFSAILLLHCHIPVSTVVARRTSIIKAGGFDESLARCDDYDMWLRTAFYGAKIAYNSTVQVRMAVGRPGSLSQSRVRTAEAYWLTLEKALRSLPLTGPQRDMVTKRAAEVRAMYQLEEGKLQIQLGQVGKARELLAAANQQLRRPLVNLAVFGLGIAPSATSGLIGLWNRIRA